MTKLSHPPSNARRMSAFARFCAITLAVLLNPAFATDEETIRQYQFEPSMGGYKLSLKEVPSPVAGPGDVLVRVKAVSLNHRDLNQLNRDYDPDHSMAGSIPLSDGAGEVIAVGRDVTRFRVGDRVAGIFFESWIEGPPSAESLASDRGGNAGGVSVFGYGSDVPTNSLMWINATASGVYVGSREDFEAMNAFISEHKIHPLIDRVFNFESAQEAYDHMQNGSFVGKIVIRM